MTRAISKQDTRPRDWVLGALSSAVVAVLG